MKSQSVSLNPQIFPHLKEYENLGFQVLSENPSPERIMDNHNPFELMLRESIQRFHSDRRSGVSNFNSLSSVFSRIIQTTPDPPLELLWFYSAVTFRTDEKLGVKLEVLERVALVKEMFGLMVSCTGSCTGLKKVAALAPVVYKLHRLVGDVMFWFPEAMDDVKCLIEGVISYVSMCCYENERGFSGIGRFSLMLMDVVSVLLADKDQVERGHIEDSRLFFPMVTDEIRARIRDGREVHFLAGTVMCQVFLLSLSLSLECCSKAPRADVHKVLHQQASQVISGFRDLNFFDNLLRMLLEPTLQVTHLVAYAGESILREVLYDVAMTAQYSFLLPSNGYQLPGHSTEVALRWLLIVEKATQFLRTRGDETKALAFENAFYESRIPGQLIEWVIQKTGTSRPVASTPAALVRWFLAIEERELMLFNDHALNGQLQGIASKSACGLSGLPVNPDTKEAECNNSSDQEMVDSTNASYTSSLFTTGSDGQGKRKKDRQDNACFQAKFIKVHCHGNYVKEKFLAQW